MNRDRPFSSLLPRRLVLSFGLVCAILAATEVTFFFGLRSIKELNETEQTSVRRVTAVLERIVKNVDQRQIEVFRHTAALSPDEMSLHEQAIDRFTETNAKALAEYEQVIDNDTERKAYADLVAARKSYLDRTQRLLALNRAHQRAEAVAFALTAQVPAYDRYQLALDKLLDFEKAEEEDIATTATVRIQRLQLASEILIGLATAILFGTGVAVFRMVSALKRDKKILELEIGKHEQAERALRKAEEKYRAIFNNASEGIFQNTPQGEVVSANPALARMLGFESPEDLIAHRTDLAQQSYVDPSKREEFRRLLKRHGVVNNFEYEVKRKDGSTIWISESTRLVRDESGNVLYEGSMQDITERKRAENVLAESERRLRFLNDLGDATRELAQPKEIMDTVVQLLGKHLAVSRCAYAEVHADGSHFTIPNDFTDGCGSIVGEFCLTDFGEHHHSNMAAGRTVVFRDTDAELTPETGADSFRRIETRAMISCPLVKNGALRAMMAVQNRTPRNWTDGEIALVEEVCERCWAIIERARAELVLRENEERLRLVIAASNDGIFDHFYETDTLTWSDRMYEMFGLDRNSFNPTIAAFIALLHPNDRAPFLKAVKEQMAAGGRYDQRMRIRRQDGTYGNFLGRGRVVRDAEGKPVRIVGALTDLTSLLDAEQRLVAQAEVLNQARDAIIIRNFVDHKVTFWNAGAERVYGWTANEAIGRPIDELIISDTENMDAFHQSLAATGSFVGEMKRRTKDGKDIIVEGRATLIRNEDGTPRSILAINTDITEKKNLETQLLRAQRLEGIGTLASGVAHDLNNVLTPILVCAEVLHHAESRQDRQSALSMIEQSARRGALIVKQVLTFARGVDGQRILTQPSHLIDEIVDIARKTFPKTIAINGRYPDDLWSINADPTQLHQVLLNLSVNARDAMPDGGLLMIAAENFSVDAHYASMSPDAKPGPYVLLEVSDTGSGMPRSVIEKIFDPFFTTKEIGKGTGLGLSTALGIVKSHGGFISVESEQGRGTTFSIFFPAAEIETDAIAVETKPEVMRGNGELILLVDDEEIIRQSARMILERGNYRVIEAGDGPEALGIFAPHQSEISAVLTDIMMPYMDGNALIRALKKIKPNLILIASTGEDDESSLTKLRALGVTDVLVKPYDADKLLKVLRDALRKSDPATGSPQGLQIPHATLPVTADAI